MSDRWRSVRARLAILCAAAVALSIALVSVVAWVVTDRALRAQVDESLSFPGLGVGAPPGGPDEVDRSLSAICDALGPEDDDALGPIVGGVQLVGADGTSCGLSDFGSVAVTAADVAVAAGDSPGGLRDGVSDTGTPVRVRSIPVADGYAVLVTRDLGDVERATDRLAIVLVVVTALGSLAALLTGWLVARASLRPLDRLTATAEHIAATEDLDVPIPVSGTDELARLATAFNRMTGALSASRVRQQQLVADASHELRTPLTSLRTNIELLARADAAGRPLVGDQRRELLSSVVAQTEELASLVTELTVLAHDEPAAEWVEVDLDDVVARAVRRATRRGDHRFVVDVAAWPMRGEPGALERALLNVLDNAVKFSPAGSTVTVTARDGVIDVDDTGAGLLPGERGQAFERFWRSPDARSLPGSGLGLAIVADTAQRHGGRAEILDAPGGGCRVQIWLPPTR